MMQIVGQPGLDIPLTGQLDQFEQLDHPGSGYRGNSLKHIQFLQKIKKSAQRGQASISKYFLQIPCRYYSILINLSAQMEQP
jgi:hypothetical protein